MKGLRTAADLYTEPGVKEASRDGGQRAMSSTLEEFILKVVLAVGAVSTQIKILGVN